GLFVPGRDDRLSYVALPDPTTEDVEALLLKAANRWGSPPRVETDSFALPTTSRFWIDGVPCNVFRYDPLEFCGFCKRPGGIPGLGCVDDVAGEYGGSFRYQERREGTLTLTIDAPISVDRGEPFNITSTVSNDGLETARNIALTAVGSPWPEGGTLYVFSPDSVLVDSLEIGEAAECEFAVTAVASADLCPLVVAAHSIESYAEAGVYQSVNEPGTDPDLIVSSNACPSMILRGNELELQATVLDNLHEIVPDAVVLGYVESVDIPGYMMEVVIPYNGENEQYEGTVEIVADAPGGLYRVLIETTEVGFDADSVITYVSVFLSLDCAASANEMTVHVTESFELQGAVSSGAEWVEDGSVYAEFGTEAGQFTVPFAYSGIPPHSGITCEDTIREERLTALDINCSAIMTSVIRCCNHAAGFKNTVFKGWIRRYTPLAVTQAEDPSTIAIRSDCVRPNAIEDCEATNQ
ncbi:hypothetical protein ACFL6M_05220, partial [Candidatus Eisenbacteria bacterium]